MKFEDDEWFNLMDKLVANYKPGELIPHENLKNLFLIKEPVFKDFDSQEEFLEAVKLLQFEYMTMIDKLRWDILENYKLYLRSIKGDGYSFLPANEQTDFAKKQTMESIRKEMASGVMIMKNLRFEDINPDERRKNADELAKLGQLHQILKSIR